MGGKRKQKHDFGIAPQGGLKEIEEILQLRRAEGPTALLSFDVILVAIDLEVPKKFSSPPQGKPDINFVNEFGISMLDTRDVSSFSSSCPPHKSLITTKQFSTSHVSSDFHDCDFTDFRECVFSETLKVPHASLSRAIKKCLQIPDTTSKKPRFRNLVIIGHSTYNDLAYLSRLGVYVRNLAPVIAILDTFQIAWSLLGPNTPNPTLSRFTLWALLQELKCPFKKLDLHNAGNDATYALHALLMLVVRSSEGRVLDEEQIERLERLKKLVYFQLHQCPRWEPIRNPGVYLTREMPPVYS